MEYVTIEQFEELKNKFNDLVEYLSECKIDHKTNFEQFQYDDSQLDETLDFLKDTNSNEDKLSDDENLSEPEDDKSKSLSF